MSNTTASAYVKNGRLCIIGVQESDVGLVPFTHVVDVGAEVEDGPVSFGEDEDPVITDAIEKARQPMSEKLEEAKMKVIAGQWVDRARAGDQNAMALISGVRQNAMRGSERAKKAARFLGEYIRANPVDVSDGNCKNYLTQSVPDKALIQKLAQYKGDDAAVSAFAPALSKKDPYLTAVVLADGPHMTGERIVSIGSHFGEEKRDFILGVKGWNVKERIRGSDAFFAGQAVGHARALQGVRTGACPVSYLCRLSGWELGEG
jgi:hypothetical protein